MAKGRYPEMPVGGCLKFFRDQWKQITDHKWVLSTIANGYKFQSFPPFSGIRETVVNANNQAILNLEKESLLQKAVTDLYLLLNDSMVFTLPFSWSEKVGRPAGCDKFETPKSVSQHF